MQTVHEHMVPDLSTAWNTKGPKAFEEWRPVIQGFNDRHCFLTHAPAVQRSSQRLLFCLAVCEKEYHVISGDVSQAFVQSETSLQRPVFIRLPKILGYPEDILFKVNFPLYGLTKAVNHWFHTNYRYHTQDPNMYYSIYEPCLLYTQQFIAIKQK